MPDATAHDARPIPARPRLRAFALGLCHSVLFALAFPPFGLWFLAFVAPLPLFAIAMRPGRSATGAGFWAMLGVAPFWIWTHGWIGSVSAAGVYPLVVYLSLYAWAFVALTSRATRIRRVHPAFGLVAVWCGLEFFRAAIAWSGYPWYLLGHPLIDSPGAALAWPAAVGGVTLVSALVALPAAVVVSGLARRRTVTVGLGLVMTAWVVWGIARPGTTTSETTSLRVAVVQTNVPQDNRMDWTPMRRMADWQRMRDLLVEAAAADPAPDLIVMPEGLVPGWTLDPVSLQHERDRGIVWLLRPETDADEALVDRYGQRVPATRVVDELLSLQRASGVPMLVGSVAFDNLRIVNTGDGLEYDNDAMYNSVYLIESGRVGDVRYDKVHLTPFGEVMPYISAWPWLEERLLAIGAEGMMFALSPGRAPAIIPLHAPAGRVDLATPICFEATMPGVTRRLAARASDSGSPAVLVNVTNDGWFGRSDRGRRMHELCARWRCVELGVPMVRCANTGVSGFIDARGRVVSSLPGQEDGVLTETVRASRPGTLFARTGEWAGWLALASVPVLAWGRRPRNSVEPGVPAEGTE